MVRRLRYPRMSAFACLVTMLLALGRDMCLGAGLLHGADTLLAATVAGVCCCFLLLSCRVVVDELGIRVGFLLSVRHAAWDELAALGALCCNSRRMYLFGLYRGHADFIHMLRRAPRCGEWGFVVPMNRKLRDAVKDYCPYTVDLTPAPKTAYPKGMRRLWRQAALSAVILLPPAGIALTTCGLMIARCVQTGPTALLLTGAAAMLAAGAFLLWRAVNTLMTCPAISESGVAVGSSVYIPWEDVRFGYIDRLGRMSGLFFLSQTVETVSRLGAAPVMCLSMPDTSTLLIAYLTYCPHAPKEERAK